MLAPGTSRTEWYSVMTGARNVEAAAMVNSQTWSHGDSGTGERHG
jgi:hypothetical protein